MFGKFTSVSGTDKLLISQYQYCNSIICRLHVRNYNVVDFSNLKLADSNFIFRINELNRIIT